MRSLTEVAVALAQFKAAHGKYPARLAALVPDFLQAIPNDAFTGGSFQYAVNRSRNGYMVKCMGLPPGAGGWTLRRDIASDLAVHGGNWPSFVR
jgi:hypothetical protein